jgi:hypothetical protein
MSVSLDYSALEVDETPPTPGADTGPQDDGSDEGGEAR